MSFNVPGDLILSDDGKQLLLVTGADQLRQALEVGLKTFRGEWIYDPAAGIPYLETVFVKGTPLEVIRQVFRDYVQSVPGVVDVPTLELTFHKDSARLSVEMRVTGEDGTAVQLSTDFVVA